MSAESDDFAMTGASEFWKWGLWSPNDRAWLDATSAMWRSVKFADVLPCPVIPLKIHQIWLGGGSPPDECQASMESWKAMHPDWEYRLWSDEDAEAELTETFPALLEPFRNAENPAERSDLLRLVLVLRHGGVYVDVDFDCLQPLDGLHSQYSFYAGLSNVGAFEINNGLFAACPQHPVVRFMCEHVTRPWAEWGGQDVAQGEAVAYQLAKSGAMGGFGMPEFALATSPTRCLETTGPGFFTRALAVSVLRPFRTDGRAGQVEAAPCAICPSAFFYPLPNSSRKLPRQERLATASPESFAIHHWCRTWLPDAK